MAKVNPHSLHLSLPANHPQIKEIKDAMEKAGQEKWGAKWPQVKKEMKPKTVPLCTMAIPNLTMTVLQVTTSFLLVTKRASLL
jgi:hypothetical protein